MIRTATLEDASIIHELLKIILKHHLDLYPDRFNKDSKYTMDEVKAIITDPNKLVYVYDHQGVKGYIIGNLYERYIFVDDLCVDPQARHQSIGEQLVSAVLAEAKRRNIPEVQLNVWNKNLGAMSFYDKLGFEPLRTILTKKTDL